MCLACLRAQLEKDYAAFAGRAVVIQPAAGPPSYVFQPVKEWHDHFPKSRSADEVVSLLASLEAKCCECGLMANFLWVGSSGLTGENFSKTLDEGITETLLRANPTPLPLCAKCCVGHLAHELRNKHIFYGEVCAPSGTADGFVFPMGY